MNFLESMILSCDNYDLISQYFVETKGAVDVARNQGNGGMPLLVLLSVQ